MKIFIITSLLSFAAVALAQSSAIPEGQNVAAIEDAPETVGKQSRDKNADDFDFEEFWSKMMADLPKKKQESKGERKKPKIDFGKLLDDLLKDAKKTDNEKDAGVKDPLGDLKGLDFKRLLDEILKKPEKEGEKLEI